MAVPKNNHTKSHRNRRRMHLFITPTALSVCPKCKKPLRPHTACLSCGFYKGREILDVFKKLTKKEQKAKQKEIKTAEKKGEKKDEMSMEKMSRK
jgi:large subunit ribosomal protein L32